MTDEEKYVAKEMSRTILELTYLKALHEAVLKKCVFNWQTELAIANNSPILKAFRKNIDEARGACDLLIDEGKLAAAHAKGMVN
jgi:hypothetical protein